MEDRKMVESKLQQQLDTMKRNTTKLRQDAEGAAADTRKSLRKQADTLEKKIGETQHKLDHLCQASDDAWESVKQDTEASWNRLAMAMHDAKERFKH